MVSDATREADASRLVSFHAMLRTDRHPAATSGCDAHEAELKLSPTDAGAMINSRSIQRIVFKLDLMPVAPGVDCLPASLLLC